MIAESLGARLLIDTIPDNLCFDGVMPPNTFNGMATMEKLLPKEFLYDQLSPDAIERQICENETYYLSDRPRDMRNSNYSRQLKPFIKQLMIDPEPRCIKMIGYFQNYPLCHNDVRQMWTPRMFSNYTMKPGANDLSIYLRCMPRHYYFNGPEFYEVVGVE